MIEAAVSVVIPAYREDAGIGRVLDRLLDAISLEHEILVVVDFGDDPTVEAVRQHVGDSLRVRTLVSSYGRGPANAIRYGIDHATHPVVVVPWGLKLTAFAALKATGCPAAAVFKMK